MGWRNHWAVMQTWMSSLPAPQWALGQGFPLEESCIWWKWLGLLHLSLAYSVWGHPKISEVLVLKLEGDL